ncbi:MAG: DUF1800 domain-containing protein [Bacteroidetes bacterium]|nr:MAG: DUF1800 domain-containing protein [Bacteroidota bacterium]
MPVSIQLKLQHLLWRAGFGPDTAGWQHWNTLPETAWWPKLKTASAPPPSYFDVADGALKGLFMGVGEVGKMEPRDKKLTDDQKKRARKQSREDLRSLNLIWLEEMVHGKAQLREKMALFWHGHFSSRNINILYQQQLLHIIRSHALGNFGDLLRAVSKSAAMLAFLNNQQNKKQHPNENFAREVMELFTLGRGNYTETDIKEAARAFTGWGFKLNGEFVFRRFFHDTEPKTVLGQTGQFDGDAVLDILLEQRQTARFIARKLYRFLVNEENIPDERIQQLGDRFYDSGYDITALLDAIFASDWFYAPENIGRKIKSPVELWVGLRRTLPLTLDDPEGQLVLQKALGQVLLYPPNVAGWPGGRSWIDSTSLMLRLRLPHIIAAQSDLDISPKDDDDQMMGRQRSKLARRLAVAVDWQPLERAFANTSEPDMIPDLARYLWQLPEANPPLGVLQKHTQAGTKTALIQSAALQLMATPEYQLC